MRRPAPTLSRGAMLASVPRLNPAVRWQELDTGEIMVIYKKRSTRLGLFLMKLLCMPELSQLIVDDIGARVIRVIDGKRSVAELIAYVSQEFKMSRKEAEVSLVKYLELLGRRDLVGFEIRDEVGDA